MERPAGNIMADCKSCHTSIPTSLHNLLAAREPDTEPFHCPICRIRTHITEVHAIQASLQQRGGVFVSHEHSWDEGVNRHKELSIKRWRAVKIKLYSDVVRYEELAQSVHRERAEWGCLDEALGLWEENSESLAEVPLDETWVATRDGFGEAVEGGGAAGTLEARFARVLERKQMKEAKRVMRAARKAAEKEREARTLMASGAELDSGGGSVTGANVDSEMKDAGVKEAGTESERSGAKETVSQLKHTEFTTGKGEVSGTGFSIDSEIKDAGIEGIRAESDGSEATETASQQEHTEPITGKGEKSSTAIQQASPQDCTPVQSSSPQDADMKDVGTKSDGKATASETKPAESDISKGEAPSSIPAQAFPQACTVSPSPSPHKRKRVSSSDSSNRSSSKRRTRTIDFSDEVTISPETLNYTPTLFPGHGISLTPPDFKEAVRLTAPAILAKAATPLSPVPTTQAHNITVWKKYCRRPETFWRKRSGYTPGRWASPTGYTKANTSFKNLEWHAAEAAWAEAEAEKVWDEKVCEDLKAISGAYVMSRMVPAALWCYRQMKIAELAAGIRSPPVEEKGDEMRY